MFCPSLNARPGGIRQYLYEALHLGRRVGRIDETGTLDDGLEFGHVHYRAADGISACDARVGRLQW